MDQWWGARNCWGVIAPPSIRAKDVSWLPGEVCLHNYICTLQKKTFWNLWIRKCTLSVTVFCMSEPEKKYSTAYQWNKLQFFFPYSGPEIYFENSEIFWTSADRKREVKITRCLWIQILKCFFTIFRWPLSVFLHTEIYTYV